MNAKSKILKLLVGVSSVAIAIAIAWGAVGQTAGRQEQAKAVINFPEGTLRLCEKQLVARRLAGRWQLCRVKRFVWQDALIVLQSEGNCVGLIRETDTADSRPSSDNNGLFIVLEVAPQTFTALNQVKLDEHILKELDKSENVLLKAAVIRPPNYHVIETK